MTNKHKLNPQDDITKDDLIRYLKNKGIITKHRDLSCPLCQNNSFAFTDSVPFLPAGLGNDINMKYRFSLTPTLIKPLPMYLSEYEEKKKKLLDEGKELENYPLDLMIKNTEFVDIVTHSHSRPLILLTCNNCGYVHMIERYKVVNFLVNDEDNGSEE